MTKKNFKLQKVISILLMAFGSVWLLIGILILFSNDNNKTDVLFGGLLIGLPTFVPGLLWFLSITKKQRYEDLETKETIVLQFIKNSGGIVTPEILAAETDLTLHEAGRELQLLVTKGVASVDVNDDGVIEYRIESLIRK